MRPLAQPDEQMIMCALHKAKAVSGQFREIHQKMGFVPKFHARITILLME